MKCPQCGHEMTLDSHRKIDLYMCYECGYIEGRNVVPAAGAPKVSAPKVSNFAHLRGLNLNESAAFLAEGLGLEEEKVAAWLETVK